ncbi:MAG: glycosyltransferase family 2 protein [Lachnospiraceae bacterium]|nr:glycosyltransferase family 2 protein [Lachnospiraceae bacterium]
MALVSVIIPVYNTKPHLRECLDSLLLQTLKDMEVICVDDGSTDGSDMILAEYAKKDSRFRLVSQNNLGPGPARNRGLGQAFGRYLIFLDSDDWFEPELLERMAAKAEETQADIVVCGSEAFDADSGRPLAFSGRPKTKGLPGDTFAPKEIAGHMFQFTCGWPWDKLYRTSFLKKTGLSYPSLPNSEDLVFVFQSLALAEKITMIRQTFIHHRANRPGSVSNSRHKDPDAACRAVLLLRQGLEREGVYRFYERSFLNWAMEFLTWNAASIEAFGIQRQYLHRLRREWLPAVGFEKHTCVYYESRETYCKYLLVKYAPWPVLSGTLKAYKRWKRRRGYGDK